MRILLIEDEPKVASFVARALREKSYAVDVTESGEKGFEMATGAPYDAILLDIRLPGIAIKRNLSRHFPYVGDETFLRQLFVIFLENAIKFSPPSTTVQIELEHGNGTVQARFRDRGVGIAPEHLAHIFKRFSRAASSGSSDAGVEAAPGGGLGLAIAHAITSAMGGWIECPSSPDGSSILMANLPPLG